MIKPSLHLTKKKETEKKEGRKYHNIKQRRKTQKTKEREKLSEIMLINESRLAIKMCSGACKNSTSNSLLDKLNNTDEEYAFDDELERVVSQTVFLLFGVIGIAGLVGNALVVLGKSSNLIIHNTYSHG